MNPSKKLLDFQYTLLEKVPLCLASGNVLNSVPYATNNLLSTSSLSKATIFNYAFPVEHQAILEFDIYLKKEFSLKLEMEERSKKRQDEAALKHNKEKEKLNRIAPGYGSYIEPVRVHQITQVEPSHMQCSELNATHMSSFEAEPEDEKSVKLAFIQATQSSLENGDSGSLQRICNHNTSLPCPRFDRSDQIGTVTSTTFHRNNRQTSQLQHPVPTLPKENEVYLPTRDKDMSMYPSLNERSSGHGSPQKSDALAISKKEDYLLFEQGLPPPNPWDGPETTMNDLSELTAVLNSTHANASSPDFLKADTVLVSSRTLVDHHLETINTESQSAYFGGQGKMITSTFADGNKVEDGPIKLSQGNHGETGSPNPSVRSKNAVSHATTLPEPSIQNSRKDCRENGINSMSPVSLGPPPTPPKPYFNVAVEDHREVHEVYRITEAGQIVLSGLLAKGYDLKLCSSFLSKYQASVPSLKDCERYLNTINRLIEMGFNPDDSIKACVLSEGDDRKSLEFLLASL